MAVSFRQPPAVDFCCLFCEDEGRGGKRELSTVVLQWIALPETNLEDGSNKWRVAAGGGVRMVLWWWVVGCGGDLEIET